MIAILIIVFVLVPSEAANSIWFFIQSDDGVLLWTRTVPLALVDNGDSETIDEREGGERSTRRWSRAATCLCVRASACNASARLDFLVSVVFRKYRANLTETTLSVSHRLIR